MASNTYASNYLQGWSDANLGLYTPPDRILQRILINTARRYELETRRRAYDDGYHDHEGAIRLRSRTPPKPPAPG